MHDFRVIKQRKLRIFLLLGIVNVDYGSNILGINSDQLLSLTSCGVEEEPNYLILQTMLVDGKIEFLQYFTGSLRELSIIVPSRGEANYCDSLIVLSKSMLTCLET